MIRTADFGFDIKAHLISGKSHGNLPAGMAEIEMKTA